MENCASLDLQDIKTCNRCEIEKNINDFYTYNNGSIKSICKKCENTNKSKRELYTCEDCGMTLRLRFKNKHENSYRHQHCRFWNEQYDSNRLQLQNCRTS